MTLLEVLVALAIASVVFGAVFLVYRTAAATAIRQRDNERSTFAPGATFAALQRDIGQLVPDGIDEQCVLKLVAQNDATAERLSELSFCCWQPDAAVREGMWATAETVAWRVEKPGTRDARLARTSAAATGPGRTVVTTNYFLPGIAQFHLQLHDGTAWLDTWPPEQEAGEKAVRPRTLRIALALRDGAGTTNWTTDCIVPIGLVITSRLERLAQPGAAAR